MILILLYLENNRMTYTSYLVIEIIVLQLYLVLMSLLTYEVVELNFPNSDAISQKVTAISYGYMLGKTS